MDPTRDPSRQISTANRDIFNMQSLNDELKQAYQEQVVLNDEKEEQIQALQAKVTELQAENTELKS